jgi:hypothetical protein
MNSIDTFVMTVVAAFFGWQWWAWRKAAMELRAFIENPNVTAVDRQQEYKHSYEAMVNALSDERRAQHEAMMQVFDYLNDNKPFGSHQEGLNQCRNVLLTAIQNSTWRP